MNESRAVAPGPRGPGGRRAADWVAGAPAARRSILGVHGRRAAERPVRWAADNARIAIDRRCNTPRTPRSILPALRSRQTLLAGCSETDDDMHFSVAG